MIRKSKRNGSLERRSHNVLHILSQLDVGGAELLVLSLLRNLDRGLFSPYVCTFTPGGALVADFEAANVPVLSIFKKHGIDLGLPLRLRRSFQASNFDIIHTHNYQPWFYACLTKLALPNVTVVHTEHSNLKPNQAKEMVIEKFLSLLTYQVVGDCRKVSTFLTDKVGVSHAKTMTIHNGIPFPGRSFSRYQGLSLKEHLNLDKNTKIVGSVGRLVEDKNYGILLSAFTNILRVGIDASLIIVGEGTARPALEKQARELQIADRVHLVGLQRDIWRYFSLFDVFVLSSKDEGLPLALLEAMMSGLPVVCTDVGGISDVVVDGLNGYLVPASDSALLSVRIRQVLLNADLRKGLGSEARKTIRDQFLIDHMVAAYQRIYLNALNHGYGEYIR